MDTFKSIAWIILKAVVAIAVVTSALSTFGAFVFMVMANHEANQIALRVTEINYLPQSEYNQFVDDFTSKSSFMGIMYAGNYPNAVHLPTQSASRNSGFNLQANWNTYCSGTGTGERGVVMSDNFDPNTMDINSSICSVYDPKLGINIDKYQIPNGNMQYTGLSGATGETVVVSLDTTYAFQIYVFGVLYVAPIPMHFTKIAKPSQYYRWG
jgi:hypothetical protein